MKREAPTKDPKYITFIYEWFHYWYGTAQLRADYFDSGLVFINYSFTYKGMFFNANNHFFPYDHESAFLKKQRNDDWEYLISFINNSDVINWQSWIEKVPGDFRIYVTSHLDSWKTTTTIVWDNETIVTFNEMKDNSYGRKAYLIVVAQPFNDILKVKTEQLVSDYLETEENNSKILLIIQLIGIPVSGFATIFWLLYRLQKQKTVNIGKKTQFIQIIEIDLLSYSSKVVVKFLFVI